MNAKENQFGDLPSALVEELLSQCSSLGNTLITGFEQMRSLKEQIRKMLKNDGLLRNKAFLKPQSIPTCCAVDGAYAIEKLLSTDIVAVAAVAIEGLTPPSENRHWNGPQHLSFAEITNHDVSSLPRGIMMNMELNIARNSPHEVVMLDGSFTTPLIHMNQAVNSMDNVKQPILTEYIKKNFLSFFSNYLEVLTSKRSDKVWIYLPKYTTKKELKQIYKERWPFTYDDRAVLTQIMEPGEFIGPIKIQAPDTPLHFSKTPGVKDEKKCEEIYNQLNNIRVLYYKPNPQMPALRIEISKTASENENIIAKILQCLEFQCISGGIFEPYPLYMADRMVKSLGQTIPIFRQSATMQMAQLYEGEISDIFFGMHGYRTENGRS